MVQLNVQVYLVKIKIRSLISQLGKSPNIQVRSSVLNLTIWFCFDSPMMEFILKYAPEDEEFVSNLMVRCIRNYQNHF